MIRRDTVSLHTGASPFHGNVTDTAVVKGLIGEVAGTVEDPAATMLRVEIWLLSENSALKSSLGVSSRRRVIPKLFNFVGVPMSASMPPWIDRLWLAGIFSGSGNCPALASRAEPKAVAEVVGVIPKGT